MKRNEQIVLLAAMSIVHRRGDLRGEKAVGKIHAANRILVSAEQLLAETPAGRERSRLEQQAARKQFIAEVLVPVKPDPRQSKTVAPPDFVVNDAFNRLIAGLRTDLHVGVEISLALEVVAKVAPPLQQQILVHCAFGKNRQQLFLLSF